MSFNGRICGYREAGGSLWFFRVLTRVGACEQLLEFERPRLIPGRFRRRQEQEPEPVGVEWKHAYYQDGMQYNTQDPYYNPAYQTYEYVPPRS